MAAEREQSQIPKLELEKFQFSPPGPMGWSFSEYEKMLEDPSQVVQNEIAVKDKLATLQGKELVELPIGRRIEEKIEEANANEVNESEELIENQISNDYHLEQAVEENATIVKDNIDMLKEENIIEEEKETIIKKDKEIVEENDKEQIQEENEKENIEDENKLKTILENEILEDSDVEEKVEVEDEQLQEFASNEEVEISKPKRIIVPNDQMKAPWLSPTLRQNR